jgi:twitching motility protein PilT
MSKLFDLDEFVQKAIHHRASDIHFQTGDEPQFRIDGAIRQINLPKVSSQQIEDLKSLLLDDRSSRQLDEHGAVDRGYQVKGTGTKKSCRLRASFAKCLEGFKVVCRIVPEDIPTVKGFGMPEIFEKISLENTGMVIVSGVTGSGKSTTIAAMIDYINQNQQKHILTLEDPIEFVHTPHHSVFTHREKNAHFESFSDGLRTALRQDPDVILVGEMRDTETIQAAMQAAETGHLVFATVHSASVADIPERIISTFPEDEQDQVRSQIANVSNSFIAQSLVGKKSKGSAAAFEILRLNNAARNLIREHKSFQLDSIMQTQRREGMVTLTQSFIDLYAKEVISADVLLAHAPDVLRAETYIKENPQTT